MQTAIHSYCITFTRIFGLTNLEETSFVKGTQQTKLVSHAEFMSNSREAFNADILSSNYVERAADRYTCSLLYTPCRGRVCGLDDKNLDHFQCKTKIRVKCQKLE